MRKRVPREYQELFCVGELTEMEKRLYGGDPYRERVGGMHYCTKTERAGDTLVLTVYPILGRSDRAKAEAARKAMSRERQTRYNRERARRRLALLMDANFGKNDLHVTLTYRGTPPDYEQARKDVRNYLRAVKRMREKAGLPKVVFHSLRHSSTTYKLKLNHGDLKATQGDTGHAQIDMITSVYAHILDEDRKINAQKFESAFYANPDLRSVRPPEEPKEPAPATLDLETLVEQLRKSPELANTLAALLASAPSEK